MDRKGICFDHMVSNILFVFQLCLGCRFGTLATSMHLSLAGSRALIHLSLPWEAGWFHPGGSSLGTCSTPVCSLRLLQGTCLLFKMLDMPQPSSFCWLYLVEEQCSVIRLITRNQLSMQWKDQACQGQC